MRGMITVVRKSSSRLSVTAMACLLGLMIGCSRPSGPDRYAVRGQVTFRGKPVPVGEIIFRPDDQAGNIGPGSVARIRDGAYATESGKGVVGGPYVVEIIGFDGVSVPQASEGRVLFDPISQKVEFPKSASTRDFSFP